MLLSKVLINDVRDVRSLGPGMLYQHLDAHTGRRLRHVHLRGFGEFTFRPKTSDCAVIREVLSDRQYDLGAVPQRAGIEATYAAIIERGQIPLIIDLGANIGASARWFAAQYPRARVVAVEPDRGNADLCRTNTLGHDVRVLTAAIGSTPGRVTLVDKDEQKWAIETVRDPTGTTTVVTVDDLLHSEPGCELFIVKVDIEGFESDLFAANTNWVHQAKVIFIEPHDWLLPDAASSASFQRVLGELDYDVLIRDENLVYVRRERSDPTR
jgi:FkbM family methyltransferase